MLLLAWVPLLHAMLVLAAALAPWLLGGVPLWGVLAALATLYLLPPCATRALLFLLPLREGEHALDGRDFLRWWATAQCQILFNRLPEFEELLRLVPGLYSLWLRLWGSRVGRLTYWSPQCRVLDRSFLEIGDRVVIGVGARLHPHLVVRSEEGPAALLLGRIRIGSGALIGGFSLLAPGVCVDRDEVTDAVLVVPPWSHLTGGKRVKGARPTIW